MDAPKRNIQPAQAHSVAGSADRGRGGGDDEPLVPPAPWWPEPGVHRAGAVVVFLLILLCSTYFLPRKGNWGSNSRIDLTFAIVDRGTIRIDDYDANTWDKAFFEGHYYLEKSVAPSIVGVPFYLALRQLLQVPPLAWVYDRDDPGAPTQSGHTPRYAAMALTLVTFFVVAVPSALLAAGVYLMAARFATHPQAALVTALAFGLGTPAFAFSNEFFSHQVAAFGSFVGFFLLWRVVEERASPRLLWIVGALFGYVAASEYVLGPTLAAVTVWAAWRMRPRRIGWLIAAAAAPWLVMTAAYNILAFRTPLPVGYRYSMVGVPPESAYGVVAPSWTSIYGVTFSPYRGLFLLSPFLLLAPVGLWLMIRQGGATRWLAMVVIFVALVSFAYNVTYWVWDGGASVGPRHLVVMLPFLALPTVCVIDRAERRWQRVLVLALVSISFLGVWSQTIVGDDFPLPGVGQPILDHAVPLLEAGAVRENVGSLIGLDGLATLIPLVVAVASVSLIVPLVVDRFAGRRRHPSTTASPARVDGGEHPV